MAKRENKIEVLGDITAYGSRYGYDALGIALLDMMRNNEIHITQENACSLWEYGGNLLSLKDDDELDYEQEKEKYIQTLNRAKSYYGKDCDEFLDNICPDINK